jgi:hypothetical protein
MFIDNTKKIICLSVPGADYKQLMERFLRSQSIPVTWFFNNQPTQEGLNSLAAIAQISETNTPQETIKKVKSIISDLGINSEAPNIQNLIDANLLQFPISEYDVYGICLDPIFRIISCFDESRSRIHNREYEKRLQSFNETVTEIQNTIENAPPMDPPLPPNLKDIILRDLNDAFIDNIGHFAPERHQMISVTYQPQTNWLKHQGQNINHIYKYDNYMGFLSDICARYNIDASLYDDTITLNRAINVTADDLSQEIKDKLLEFYAEDKALYDSL